MKKNMAMPLLAVSVYNINRPLRLVEVTKDFGSQQAAYKQPIRVLYWIVLVTKRFGVWLVTRGLGWLVTKRFG